MSKTKSSKTTLAGSRGGIWVLIVAAVLLEATAGVQYFASRDAIKREVMERADSELKRAELDIMSHTIEMEAAAKTLAMLAEKHVDTPDSIYAATRSIVATLHNTSSVAVAYRPYYLSGQPFFEACSSRINEDSIFTRQIGSAEHDYTQMEWFQNGLRIDSCWWCEPYLDDSGSRTYVVSCSHPVRGRNGEIVASVCVDLSLAGLQQLAENFRTYKESNCAILSERGQEIVPPDTIPGRKYFFFDEEIEATGWHLHLRVPYNVLFSEQRKIGLIVSIMMLVGIILLAFILSRTAKAIRKTFEFAEKNQRMENELEVARTIQMAMLPKVFPPFADRTDLNIYGMVKSAKEVGGDLYDFYVRHDKLFFAVGDVSGKGVPAALVMATTRSLFRSVTAHEEHADKIVMEMNNTLTEANDQNMFITLFIGVLDLKSGLLDYCNAGHNAPVLLQNAEQEKLITMLPVVANLPIGVLSGFAYEAQTMTIHYNDLLFLYTDGLTEAENSRQEQFGEQRMLEALQAIHDKQPQNIVDAMQSATESFVGTAPQSDDLTMLAIRYQQPALLMRNDIQQIPTLAEWVEGLHIPDELSMSINLALEEIVANVMLYAYPESQNGRVMVESWRSSGNIYFCISDSGVAFDPTNQPEVDINLSAEERSIGGLGIHLVRQIMDEIHYERRNDKNILTLVKKL